MMISVNPKVIGLTFAGLYACALALQLALTTWVAVAGPRPWDKTTAQHVRDMLAGNAVEEQMKYEMSRHEPPMTRTEKERRERVVPLWVRCARNDMTDWLESDDRALSTRIDRHQASWLRARFIAACKAKLGIQIPLRRCGFCGGTRF